MLRGTDLNLFPVHDPVPSIVEQAHGGNVDTVLVGGVFRKIVVFPGIFGSPIDPSSPFEDRDVAQLGTGLWNRMLIDATRSWRFQRRAEWDNERFPPTVRPAPEDEARVRARWQEYGLGDR